MTGEASKHTDLPPRYEIMMPLGKGGGGEVWAVRDRITHKVLALKCLALGADENEELALVREAVALSGVEGLGVPRVLRFGRLPKNNRSYMVRELVEGTSLADRLDGTSDVAPLLEAIAQTADQLTLLHRALLLHGDIKPANIIVGPDGTATLVDLGLAAAWKEGGAIPKGLTPQYAAPELLTGAPLTVRAEVFALGATVSDVLRTFPSIEAGIAKSLGALVERATAARPEDRFPSADEFSSALRRAAKLAQPSTSATGFAWPIVGLDEPSAELLERVQQLKETAGIVLTGPEGSGRSALLRRVAWSLGIEGRRVVWLDASIQCQADDALTLELGAFDDEKDLVILVDDADQLAPPVLLRLDALRTAGARLLMAASGDGSSNSLPGRTFEIFAMPRLPSGLAEEVVHRSVPSLSEAVVQHVVARADSWPGRLRAIVRRLDGKPVVAPADVDAILEQIPISSAAAASRRPTDVRAEITGLLDRGHFEEAAELLAAHESDPSPQMAIARARLFTNRGEAQRSLTELEGVHKEVLASADGVLRSAFFLHLARAHLRAGNYAEAESSAVRVEAELDKSPSVAVATKGRSKAAGAKAKADRRAELMPILAEALAVCGLARSFASQHMQAREVLDRAVSMAREISEPRLLSVALGSLAFALQRDDNLADAKEAYEEGLEAAEKAGDAGSVATVRLNLAGIAKAQGDLATALAHLEAGVDMGRRSGRLATLRQALLNLANLNLYLGRLSRARASIEQLSEQRAELPPQFLAQLLALEAEYAANTGDPTTAEQRCLECAMAYEAMGRVTDAAEARLERVLIATGRSKVDTASLDKSLLEVEQQLGDTPAHRALLQLCHGRVAAAAGKDQKAVESLEKAIAAAREKGQRDYIWRALEAKAAVLAQSGQLMGARRDREAALSILEEIAAKLPRDLREVYWNDSRRRSLRASQFLEISHARTVNVVPSGSDRLARVLEVNREIAGTYDLPRLLERVTDNAIALLSAERGFVILRSQNRHTESGLSIHASRDQAGDDPHARFSQSIAERVISSGDPIVTTSALDDDRMADYVSVHQLMLQSVACVPIRSRESGVIGALYLETRLRPGTSFSDELPTLQALSDQVAIAIETARLMSENEQRRAELAAANEQLEAARVKLEEALGHRTAQLAATRKDLRSARAVLRSHFGYHGLVGRSDAMRRVYALIDRVKDNDVPVLITGESGTGKEIIARAIHNAGARGKQRFVGINCGAIPEHLLESELFGHTKGAFTGADRDRKGLFRESTDGSILLDEIGEMPQKMQAGLLRVLQEKVVRPVGGLKEEPVNTRVIAATHRDLEAMVQEGTFREDLFYRLHVIQVRVPPLRERLDDLPMLIDHFLGIFAARYSRERRSVSRGAIKRLMAYAWPGNVRQMENVLLNAWVLSDRPELEVEDFELPDDVPRASRAPVERASGAERTKEETSFGAHRANEKDRILHALSSCNWNRVKAAELIGLPRRTFYRRLKEYGIQ